MDCTIVSQQNSGLWKKIQNRHSICRRGSYIWTIDSG